MCDMATGRLELCNRIRMEAEDIERTGFPLEVLPQTVQRSQRVYSYSIDLLFYCAA